MENERVHDMFFGRSFAIDEENDINAETTAELTGTFTSAEAGFIEKLKSGDPDAFDRLVTRYSQDIYAVLLRLTEDPEEAGDLTQETFVSALKSIKGFRGDAELRTWLIRIAINNSRNRFRWWKRRRRDRTISLDATIGDSQTTIGEMIESGVKNPEDVAIRTERERSLRQAMTEIQDIYREAIVLCDIEGYSYEEIGQMLEINIGTVKSRIARGREELRRKLKAV
ncbi:MAG: sigma-70 family RNA polymerase sigma factor [Pyrinomonadaceae bacterium]|nr:sigma-70 family RNA polymerase sigma factor [Pyrinomonadaceae bacterium]